MIWFLILILSVVIFLIYKIGAQCPNCGSKFHSKNVGHKEINEFPWTEYEYYCGKCNYYWKER